MINKIYFALTLAGVLFSGYLSSVKFFTKTCAFNEGCPYFLGYPACYYGFIIFLSMFITTIYANRKSYGEILLSKKLAPLSALGILFSGYFVVIENFKFSTCAIGLVFYILIFSITVKNIHKIQGFREK